MEPAVGMTFMVADWALAKPRVLAVYLLIAAVGTLTTGFGYLACCVIG